MELVLDIKVRNEDQVTSLDGPIVWRGGPPDENSEVVHKVAKRCGGTDLLAGMMCACVLL